MDLKALMQKLETIDKKEVLTESEKKETTWTDKSGKKHPATQVKGDKYTGKEAEKDGKKSKKDDLEEGFTSAIARALVEEFGYEIDEADDLSQMKVWKPGQDGPTVGDPTAKAAAPAAEKMADGGPPPTPEQLKWLGGADKTDPIILARMRKAVPNAPAGGQAASPAAAAPAAATGTTAVGDDEGNTMITKPDGTTQVVGPDGNVIKPGSNPNLPQNKAQAATIASGQPDDATGVDAAVAANAAKPSTATAAAPAGGQAASPAKPAAAKPGFKADPLGQSIANQLKMTTPDAIKLFQKNNGLAVDGQIGPATTKALQAAAQKMGLTVASGVGTSTAGGGRGGQGGPTATQMAQAPAAGGQAASPAANPKVADIDAQLAKYKKYPESNAQIIARLEKEKAALSGGSTQTPAQQAVAKDIGNFAGESIRYQDDAVLSLIRGMRI